ncbi:MAG: MMPL family transporter [Bacteroidales bacterium]|nr:MMPL family transporter [Bacteroidales bacterium]
MWTVIAGIILRNRIALIIALSVVTIFMAYKASFISMSYEYARMLPEKDTAYLEHMYFKKLFGEEANVLIIGIKDTNFFEQNKFNDWIKLSDKIKDIDGVKNVMSVAQIVNISKNSIKRKFETSRIFPDSIKTQTELDSLVNIIQTLPFYKNILYNDTSHIYLMAITLEKKELNSKKRYPLIENITKELNIYVNKYNQKYHISGLPYIRTEISKKIKNELRMFTFLALIVCIIVLYLFFRSFKVVFFSTLVVVIGVIWAVGSMVLFGFKITILTGMIPPLLIVIGIPNSIFLLNKYHSEYKIHGNKIKALQRVIKKIGNAIFLTNLTTASGFAAFIITSSDILNEFGIIASINIMGVFILALLLIPIIFSFLGPPKKRHVKHLDDKIIKKTVESLVFVTLAKRNLVYLITFIILGLGIFGIFLMKSTGYVVDDIPHKDQLYIDVKFFEKNFNGVIPFEILIDTKKKNGALQLKNLKKIDRLEKSFSKYPELSKPISISNAIKFLRQAFYNGKERQYKLPDNMNKGFIMSYASKSDDNGKIINSFVDSLKQITRISLQISDIGTMKMNSLIEKIKADINSIFPPEKYDVITTGTSIIFFKGTTYLIKNLFVSLLLAILVISFFMAWMFSSFRMVILSLIPNLIPLFLTASLMGFFGIPIKPSTILVFSISFGISVDNTIHFLSKYRQELLVSNWNISYSVIAALKETGVSMIYTSTVLFFGFGIFTLSSFGGTASLGMLVSITLLLAMLSNLVLLPSLLLSLEKAMTTKAFKEPLLQIFEEEEDIDINELRLAGK